MIFSRLEVFFAEISWHLWYRLNLFLRIKEVIFQSEFYCKKQSE